MIAVKFGKLGGGDVAVAVVIEGAEHLEQMRLVHEVHLHGEHRDDGHRQLFELYLALRVCVVSTGTMATASSLNSTLLSASAW
jgi:hypothetical protein